MRLKPVVKASEFMRFGFKPCRGLPKSAESYYLCVKNGHRVMFVDSKHFTETEWPIKDARIHKNPNCKFSDKRTATEIECELVVRLTTYHCGKAVIKDKNKLSEAMEKLAEFEEKEKCGEWLDAIELAKIAIALQSQKWIPCSERLPEDNTDVIVCFYSGIVTEMRYWENGNFQGIYEHTTKSIVAWMPLPKPYREGE